MQVICLVAVAAVIFLLGTVGVYAAPAPCATAACVSHAPAPLLAAGIPAFAALGGGATVYGLWKKFIRRS